MAAVRRRHPRLSSSKLYHDPIPEGPIQHLDRACAALCTPIGITNGESGFTYARGSRGWVSGLSEGGCLRVVTFLLTDVVSSTRLWQDAPTAMDRALSRHEEIIRTAVDSHGGATVKARGEGDSTFNVFAEVTAAGLAAVEAQRRLSDEDWPPDCPIVVRMAIHAGEAVQRDGDYFGSTVNRTARIRGIAEGGEILVSSAAAGVISTHLPPAARLIEVGRPKLKDLQGRDTIHMLQLSDADGRFASPRSLGLADHNLPQQMTSFVGREQEMADIARLLDTHRLVTLMGTGGAGKSRLAVQTAIRVLENFDDGAWLVELAPLDDPDAVGPAVAAALSIVEQPGRPILDTVLDAMHDRQLLILLDNCEHLIDKAAKVTETIVRDCPDVTILVTSREPLRIEGEGIYRVPSLTLPPNSAPVEDIAGSDAVRLFVERARAHRPGLHIDDRATAAVGSICAQLDGMPLPIELAAARVSALSVDEIQARLDHRFRLLSHGSRTALPRHQTLQAMVDWSYELLVDAERAVLRRLSVFAGGFTLEAAEAVCADTEIDETDVVDLLASLVDKSLVQADEGEEPIRYRLLETIRVYAGTKLAESSEIAETADRHLAWFVVLAERAEPQLVGRDAKAWLAILESEHDNLRVALQTAAEPTRISTGLRLATALGRFWDTRGYLSEGRDRLKTLLALNTDVTDSIRIRALIAAARLTHRLGEEGDARGRAQECLELSLAIGDQWGKATALNWLGNVAIAEGDHAHARELFESSIKVGREIGDKVIVSTALCNLGLAAMCNGDPNGSRRALEESLALDEEMGWAHGMAFCLGFLGDLANDYGEYSEGHNRHQQALALREELGDRVGICWSLCALGTTSLLVGDYVQARQYLEESLSLQRELGRSDRGEWPLVEGGDWALSDLGEVSAAEGDYSGARSLFEQSLVRTTVDCRTTTLIRLGNLASKELSFAESETLHQEAMRLIRTASDQVRLAACLEGLATTAKRKAHWKRSAILFGTASASRESTKAPLPPYQRDDHDSDVAEVRAQLGDAEFEAAFLEGTALQPNEVIDYALRADESSR